jgi:hypothetical protein
MKEAMGMGMELKEHIHKMQQKRLFGKGRRPI